MLNPLVPPGSSANSHPFREGWPRVQPEFSHQGDLRTRFDRFDHAGRPCRVDVKYSFGRHRKMDEFSDSNPFLSTVTDGLDLFRRYIDPPVRLDPLIDHFATRRYADVAETSSQPAVQAACCDVESAAAASR